MKRQANIGSEGNYVVVTRGKAALLKLTRDVRVTTRTLWLLRSVKRRERVFKFEITIYVFQKRSCDFAHCRAYLVVNDANLVAGQ
jgi:hypothetical protein